MLKERHNELEYLLSYFLSVSTQVIILVLLMSVGVVLTKTKVLTSVGAKQMTDLVIYFVTPAVIIKAFAGGEVVYSPENVTRLLVAAGAAVLVHVVSLAIGLIFFGNKKDAYNKIYTAAVLMSNCGFMSLPLTQAVLGDQGVFIVTVFVGVFNVVAWSIGLALASGQKISVKKMFINPGFIPVVAGIVMFLCRVDLSGIKIVMEPIRHLAAINTPVPMVIIGYYLANAGLKIKKGDGKMFLAISLRLVLVPLISMVLLRTFGIVGDDLTACIIPASAPVAALLMMMSAKYSDNPELSSRVVTISHLLSVITMPLMLTLCKYIGG